MSTPACLRDAARRRRLALAAALCALPWLAAPALAADDWAALGDAGVVLFRHAEAPGIGDPPGLVLGDCRTQRNLDETGRAQARRIGEAFRARGVQVGAVLSSRWCRTLETAELAFPGQVRGDARFDSFFGERTREPAQTAAAREVIAQWRGPGVLVVVTHQVNISALTGVSPASGEGVVVRREGDSLVPAGRLRP